MVILCMTSRVVTRNRGKKSKHDTRLNLVGEYMFWFSLSVEYIPRGKYRTETYQEFISTQFQCSQIVT